MNGRNSSPENAISYFRAGDIQGLELYRGVGVTRHVPRHVHGMFSLSVAEAGVRISESKRQKYRITPGSIFVSEWGEAHAGDIPSGTSYSSRSLRISRELFASLLAELPGREASEAHFPMPLVDDAELYGKIFCLHMLVASPESQLAKECLLREVFSLLVNRHSRRKDDWPAVGDETAAVRRVCDYLGDCCRENVSIGTLAAIAGFSPFHLCRVFERAVGVPPHVYQLDVRLTKAAELLAGGRKIITVALETGFCDQSHFHKAFKRKFGVTPRQYLR
ncbi:AraC family transcriptional regulator [Anaeroselena agilis]|uniref:AraC family transcriptional regulator n=1 Tax=Anaeroselena agilis TaxID=3063788 RepID=A0ABU3P2P2_9FIRM|nr:AraC family transcriptional regulator [Selenomonadales bacterium 4137-cl]